MIAHVSMPADDCELVARALAEMMNGTALRFPPGGPDAWNCWSKDNSFQIVVTPRGQVLVPNPNEASLATPGERVERASETHFAMAVPRDAASVVAIARRLGWQARICNRGDMFHVVEVWVENAYLVEVLDPRQLADYERNMTVAGFKHTFALADDPPRSKESWGFAFDLG